MFLFLAIFMVDNNDELWLWQGWWPEKEEEVELADQTGSGAVRWQAERRAAMQTAIDYWSCRFENWAEPVPAYLVWAGLEPQEFINLFPSWCERKDIAELNMRVSDIICVELCSYIRFMLIAH